ncbi:MAG: acyltransferase [Endozoicomonadaceae bacterium]|nr:acyltransferase [Endozoicomonadaceae bacterium]
MIGVVFKVIDLFIRKIANLILRIRQRSIYSYLYSNYKISNLNFFQGIDSEIYGSGGITIGELSYCGNRCAFQVASGFSISIGNNVCISHNVRIYTSNRDARSFIEGGKVLYNSGNVKIGDNVWIGSNVFIREGVSIGSHCVIGANSVVTKDVKPKSIVGGVPAMILSRKLK